MRLVAARPACYNRLQRPKNKAFAAMNRSPLTYSLILLAGGDPAREAKGLASLSGLDGQAWEALVVLPGGSEERLSGLQQTLASLGVPARVLALPPCPAGAARNQGAEQSRGEVLVFTQAVCLLPPDLLARIEDDLADADLAGVGGLCRPANPSEPLPRLLGLELELGRGEQLPDAVCAAYRRREFLDAGGFDPADDSEGLENFELAYRLVARGQELALDPELSVRRPLPASWSDALGLAYHVGRNRFRNILHRRRLGLRGGSGTNRFWQSVLVLAAVGFPLALAGRDPGGAFTWSAICLLLLYPLNRSFLKQVSHREPELMSRALLWCLLRPWAWTLGMIKAALDRMGGPSGA
jgi:hypothetical protein